MDRMQAAEQLLRVLQIFASTLTETQALEVAAVYPAWETGRSYAVGEIIRYGKDPLGDPKLYKVIQAHTSQEDWTPDASASLYDAFGMDGQGTPLWSQPAGAHDAYQTGDIVSYSGIRYESMVDGNVWRPDAYGWKQVE